MCPLPKVNIYQLMANLAFSLCQPTTAHLPMVYFEVKAGHQFIIDII